MLIDTHAHIYLDAFEDDFESMLDRARAAGVERIVMPAIDVPSVDRAIDLCDRYDGLFAMAAIHPSEAKTATEADFFQIVDLCAHPRVVAVGETGLDYYWDRSFDDKQQDFLRQHIRLGVDADLPVVFHNREATTDLLRIVEEERAACADPSRLRGIFHCFTGTPGESERIRGLGFHVGIGGIVTFKNAGLGGTVARVPLEWMVLETDAPYLAPDPYRGKRNEPAYTLRIAQKIAEIKETTLDFVTSTTTANAESIFDFEAS